MGLVEVDGSGEGWSGRREECFRLCLEGGRITQGHRSECLCWLNKAAVKGGGCYCGNVDLGVGNDTLIATSITATGTAAVAIVPLGVSLIAPPLKLHG